MEFGKRLQQLRQEKGLTQEQLAKEFYTSRQNISSWENGKTYPNMQDLVHLSDFFGVSLDVAQDLLKVPLQAEVWLIVFFIIVSAANNIEEFNKEFGIKVIYPWQLHLRK